MAMLSNGTTDRRARKIEVAGSESKRFGVVDGARLRQVESCTRDEAARSGLKVVCSGGAVIADLDLSYGERERRMQARWREQGRKKDPYRELMRAWNVRLAYMGGMISCAAALYMLWKYVGFAGI